MFERVLNNACPACRRGKVFRSFMSMNELCPNCGYKFERESGFFLGATSISYVCGFVIALPFFLYLLFSKVPLWVCILLPVLPVLPFVPVLFRFSRLIWIHAQYKAGE